MKKASIEDHKKMGEVLKDAEATIHSVLDEAAKLHVFRAKQTNQILRIINIMTAVRSQCEDIMFAEHPEITDQEGFHIYF